MCAMTAGQRGKRVAILEHNDRPGKKIRISGGGRSNFTNLYVEAENYASQNPHFCKSALARYTQYDFIDLVERHHIAYHERLHGQLFCNESAQQLIDMLCQECSDVGVDVVLRCKVASIEKDDDTFIVSTNQGVWTAASVVVATGGLSIPKIGATGFGYQVATSFGLPLVDTAPALVPFTWNQRDKSTFAELSGISFPARVSCGSMSFEEQLLLTHRGLSGPVILQISLHWSPGQSIGIDLLPGENVFEELAQMRRENGSLQQWLRGRLPKRFLQHWGEQYVPTQPMAQLSNQALEELARNLEAWEVMPNGTEGYRTAEATVGGVDTNALSSRTMEALDVPGLFFIGEVVDVTGWLGGYNFQWAWSSGHAAGQAV